MNPLKVINLNVHSLRRCLPDFTGPYILSLTPSAKTKCKGIHILREQSLRNHFQFVNNTEQYSNLLARPSSRDNTQPGIKVLSAKRFGVKLKHPLF